MALHKSTALVIPRRDKISQPPKAGTLQLPGLWRGSAGNAVPFLSPSLCGNFRLSPAREPLRDTAVSAQVRKLKPLRSHSLPINSAVAGGPWQSRNDRDILTLSPFSCSSMIGSCKLFKRHELCCHVNMITDNLLWGGTNIKNKTAAFVVHLFNLILHSIWPIAVKITTEEHVILIEVYFSRALLLLWNECSGKINPIAFLSDERHRQAATPPTHITQDDRTKIINGGSANVKFQPPGRQLKAGWRLRTGAGHDVVMELAGDWLRPLQWELRSCSAPDGSHREKAPPPQPPFGSDKSSPGLCWIRFLREILTPSLPLMLYKPKISYRMTSSSLIVCHRMAPPSCHTSSSCLLSKHIQYFHFHSTENGGNWNVWPVLSTQLFSSLTVEKIRPVIKDKWMQDECVTFTTNLNLLFIRVKSLNLVIPRE